jgi:hypothetical protein
MLEKTNLFWAVLSLCLVTIDLFIKKHVNYLKSMQTREDNEIMAAKWKSLQFVLFFILLMVTASIRFELFNTGHDAA